MSLRKKILIPILCATIIITCIFSYLIYQLYIEHQVITEASKKIENLYSLNNQLTDLQYHNEFSVLAYFARKDPVLLEEIASNSNKISATLDQMYPYLDTENARDLARKYIQARNDMSNTRNDFIAAINTDNQEEIQRSYSRWNLKSQILMATFSDLDAYNVTTSHRALFSIEKIRYQVIITVLTIMTIILILILFLYFYLEHIITFPIHKLTRMTEKITKTRFLTSPIKIHTHDEIGILARDFTIMNNRLRNIYRNLERKIKERTKQIEKEKEKYKIVTTHFPNGGVALLDRQLKIITAGGDEYGKLGLDPKAIEGKAIYEIFPQELMKQAMPSFNKTLQGKETMFESQFNNKIFLTRNIPIRDHSGDVSSFISMSQDITTEKELARQKDSFIGVASHELKTPVTSIYGYIQILERRLQHKKDKKNLYFALSIRSQVDRVITLIENLLNVSKIDSGALDLHKKNFNLYSLVKKVVVNLQLTNGTHEITIENVDDLVVNGDMDRIEQVIINLLSNAIKYSPNANKVIVHIKKQENLAVVAVEDSGMGIKKSDIPNLYKKFFRSYDGEKGRISGFGLGLSIAYEIVKRHGGDMWVESKLRKGSTFYFSLPI